jgi:hypothetical protein
MPVEQRHAKGFVSFATRKGGLKKSCGRAATDAFSKATVENFRHLVLDVVIPLLTPV